MRVQLLYSHNNDKSLLVSAKLVRPRHSELVKYFKVTSFRDDNDTAIPDGAGVLISRKAVAAFDKEFDITGLVKALTRDDRRRYIQRLKQIEAQKKKKDRDEQVAFMLKERQLLEKVNQLTPVRNKQQNGEQVLVLQNSDTRGKGTKILTKQNLLKIQKAAIVFCILHPTIRDVCGTNERKNWKNFFGVSKDTIGHWLKPRTGIDKKTWLSYLAYWDFKTAKKNMLPFFRCKVEGIGLDEDSKIASDILQPYMTDNLKTLLKINTDYVNNRAGNKKRDSKRQLTQRYITKGCKRVYQDRSSKWLLIATWLIDFIEKDMRLALYHEYGYYTTILRKFTHEKFVNATRNASHSSNELDQVAAAWFKHHHEFDEITKKPTYSVDSNNVPPRVSAWFSKFFKRYGL